MKAFKDMTETDFTRIKRKLENMPLGAFPRYCQDLKGYEFYHNSRRIWKWELFDEGYRNIDFLLNNATDIKAVIIKEALI